MFTARACPTVKNSFEQRLKLANKLCVNGHEIQESENLFLCIVRFDSILGEVDQLKLLISFSDPTFLIIVDDEMQLSFKFLGRMKLSFLSLHRHHQHHVDDKPRINFLIDDVRKNKVPASMSANKSCRVANVQYPAEEQ